MATAEDYGLFWNSVNGDRKYNADSMELWLKKFFTSGVFVGELQVTARGNSMIVDVQKGYANLDGKPKNFTSSQAFTIEAAHAYTPRIDTIVVRRDNEARNITLAYVKGAYNGQNPVPTAPVRNGSLYELVLAQIRVNAGATFISQSNITDTRGDDSVCGYVAAAVTEERAVHVKVEKLKERLDASKGRLVGAHMLQFQEDHIYTNATKTDTIKYTLNNNHNSGLVIAEVYLLGGSGNYEYEYVGTTVSSVRYESSLGGDIGDCIITFPVRMRNRADGSIAWDEDVTILLRFSRERTYMGDVTEVTDTATATLSYLRRYNSSGGPEYTTQRFNVYTSIIELGGEYE